MGTVVTVRVAHTAQLGARDLVEVRALMDTAFDGGFADDDYEHALGGMHALVRDGRDLVAHGSVVMRRLLHDGRALRTGYVEAVAVRADRRRQGLGGLVMDAIEQVIRGGYQLGALSSSAMATDFYQGRGWQAWTGTTSVLGPDGPRRLPGEEDAIYVLPVSARLTRGGDLACDWRGGDVW
jgi:aminoglycoside 2'-N-acetyltransferase I